MATDIVFYDDLWYNKKMISTPQESNPGSRVRKELPLEHLEQPFLAQRVINVGNELTNSKVAVPDLTELSLLGIDLTPTTYARNHRLMMSLAYSAQNLGLGAASISVSDSSGNVAPKRYVLTGNGESWERYSPRDKLKSEARMSNSDMLYELQFLLMGQNVPESLFNEDALNGLETAYIVANFLFAKARKKESYIRFGVREPIVGSGDYIAEKATILSVRDRGYSKEHALTVTASHDIEGVQFKKSYTYGVTSLPRPKRRQDPIERAGGFVTISSPNRIPNSVMSEFVEADLEDQVALGVFHAELDNLRLS